MSWKEYHEKTRNHPPRKLLTEALSFVPEEWVGDQKTAVDLGSGSGQDTRELLRRGWRVTAIDNNGDAIEALAQEKHPELHCVCSSFESLDSLPQNSLTYASLSLPFCKFEAFPDFWKKIDASISIDGIFAGNFFGPEDDWVKAGSVTGHSRSDVEGLLGDFEILEFREDKKAAKTLLGEEKFWHVHTVVARKAH